MNKSRAPVTIFFIIVFIGLLVAIVWGNYRFSGYQIFGEGFNIQWLSIRSLVTQGASPYSEQVTSRIQDALASQNAFVTGLPPKYTSPLISALITFPFALIGDQTIAHSAWTTLQLLAIFLILAFSIKLTAWRPAWYILLPFSIFTIFSYHVVIPWLDGSLSIWSALFLVSALLAVSQNKNELAGILLGLSAIQPQMVILPVLFTLVWAGVQKRRLLILWFFITLILLSIIGSFIVPDWSLQYVRILFNFSRTSRLAAPVCFSCDYGQGWVSSLAGF